MFTLDVTPLIFKLNRVKDFRSLFIKLIEDAYGEVTRSIIISLSGPIIPERATKEEYPKIGTIPIPWRTANLFLSARNKQSTEFLKFFWLDPNVAKYRTYVHDGTKYQEKRPVFQIQTDYWRPIVYRKWRSEYKKFLATL